MAQIQIDVSLIICKRSPSSHHRLLLFTTALQSSQTRDLARDLLSQPSLPLVCVRATFCVACDEEASSGDCAPRRLQPFLIDRGGGGLLSQPHQPFMVTGESLPLLHQITAWYILENPVKLVIVVENVG